MVMVAMVQRVKKTRGCFHCWQPSEGGEQCIRTALPGLHIIVYCIGTAHSVREDS